MSVILTLNEHQRHGIVLPRGALVLGTDTIEPVVGSAEVASRIPNDGDVEVFQGSEDVLPEAILVGQRVTGVVDAAVDASAHVPIEKPLVHVQLMMRALHPTEYS